MNFPHAAFLVDLVIFWTWEGEGTVRVLETIGRGDDPRLRSDNSGDLSPELVSQLEVRTWDYFENIFLLSQLFVPWI